MEASGSSLPDAAVEQSGFFVTLRSLAGHSFHVACSPDWLINDLKLAIEKREGFPARTMRLIFAGHQLDKDRNLGSYEIVNGSAVYFVSPVMRD